MPTSLSRSSLSRIALTIVLAVPLASLAACTTDGIGTASTSEATCAAYGDAIDYSGTKDTHATSREVRVKNQTFHDLGCF